MADVMVKVCDVDLLPDETVRRYIVTVDGETSALDLCDLHAGPFARIPHDTSASDVKPAASIPKPAKRASGGQNAPGRHKRQATLEEIEALKAGI